jgi:predicted glycosyltransferase
MKILVDLNHPVDVNFFKNAIAVLAKKHDCEIDITLQPRGKLVPILQKELPGFHFTSIGIYRKSFAGKVFGAGYRFVRLLSYVRRGKFDAVVSFGGISVCHATYVLGKPSIIFDDDIEYKLGFYPYKSFATRLVMPAQIPIQGRNIVKYKGFKELAYLHPNRFKPDEGALKEYGLRPGEYVFVREVSKISMNYAHLETGQLAGVCSHLKTLGLDIVLSLEDKSLRDRFSPHCIILEEPVRDIYSLMHFAQLTISSGDTMARESCLTGTPVIYTGGRYMSVNTELTKKGIFFEPDDEHSIMNLVGMIIEQNIKEKTRETVQRALADEWEDTTEVIVNNVLGAIRDDQSSHEHRGKSR